MPLNKHGQPVGEIVKDWSVPETPRRTILAGHYCSLAPLESEAHAAELFQAFESDSSGQDWTYLSYGPFPGPEEFFACIAGQSRSPDPLFFAVIDDESKCAAGLVSFMRMAPAAGTIEIGHIHFSPRIQRRVVATEAIFLMLRCIFSLGYRRCEWKCNALNEGSRRAALRLGFSFEGIFRQAGVVKGRNRDTAWYSMLDREWPALSRAFESWLAPENFTATGDQRRRLSELTAKANEREA